MRIENGPSKIRIHQDHVSYLPSTPPDATPSRFTSEAAQTVSSNFVAFLHAHTNMLESKQERQMCIVRIFNILLRIVILCGIISGLIAILTLLLLYGWRILYRAIHTEYTGLVRQGFVAFCTTFGLFGVGFLILSAYLFLVLTSGVLHFLVDDYRHDEQCNEC